MRPLRVRTYVRRPPSVRSSHRTAAAVDRRFLSTTTCQGFVLQSPYMYKLGSTACCARPLRSSLPTAIGFSHGLALARMQSKQRSTSRPGRSALRKLHMSFRGGTGTPHAVPPAVFSLFLLLRRASETDRHAGGWIRYFLARINFSVRGLMYHIYI